MKTLILGSNSPRRKEILSQLGFSYETRASDIDETVPVDMNVSKVAEHLAIQKNAAISREENEVIITADTVVIINGTILGKPKDAKEAFAMLQQLSGQSHSVITGVCISSVDCLISFSTKTEVQFNKLTNEHINHYIEIYKPYDKAGAYGIQEWIGLIATKEIKGSYLNVVGLPADRVFSELVNNFGLRPLI